MLVIQDAWAELNDFVEASGADHQQVAVNLALGKDPLNTALLLPVAYLAVDPVSATAEVATMDFEQIFKAHGTAWATKYVAIDFTESGELTSWDIDVHMDWDVTEVDWWTWFVSWNDLEASPDGMLVDGERAYA